jgi:chromate transporter
MWEERFLHAFNHCILLRRSWPSTSGGDASHREQRAGPWFVVPGALVMLGAESVPRFGHLKVAVLAVIVEAVMRIARRAMNDRFAVSVAIAAFFGIHLQDAPFPLILPPRSCLAPLAKRWNG